MADATWYAALLATPFASSLIPLTLRLIPLIAEIAREIQQFRRVEPTPQSTYHFENRLDHLLREMGREIVDWVYNEWHSDFRKSTLQLGIDKCRPPWDKNW